MGQRRGVREPREIDTRPPGKYQPEERYLFDNALITRAGVERQTDLGLLAETIFFYQSAHLLLNRASVTSLATKIPTYDLLSLLKRSEIKLSYIRPTFGVLTAGPIQTHDFGAFSFAATSERRKIKSHTDEISESIERELGKSTKTRKLINALEDRIRPHKFRGPEGEDNSRSGTRRCRRP